MNKKDYSDIVDLPHYEPRFHARMPLCSRAAQFAPFAALRGFEKAIEEKQEIMVCESVQKTHVEESWE